MTIQTREDVLLVDWGQDGTFAHAGADIYDYVRVTPAVRVQRGRDSARSYSPPMIGRYSLTLDNQDLTFTRENAGSTLYGHLDPGKWVWHRVWIGGAPGLGGVEVYPFRGLLDDIQLAPSMRSRSASLSALGTLSFLQSHRVTTHLYTNIRVDQAIEVVLEQCSNPGHPNADKWGVSGSAYKKWGAHANHGHWIVGWQTAFKAVDVSSVTLAYWWLDDANALDAVLELLATEGTGANLYEDGSGRIVFKRRLHRSHDTRSVTSQVTFIDGATLGPVNPAFSDIAYTSGLRDIINDATVSVVTRMVGQASEVDTVWAHASTIDLAANTTLVLTAVFHDTPVWDVATIAEGTDYSIAEGSAIVSVYSVTSTQATIAVRAGPDGVVLTGLRLRGRLTVTDSKVWETSGTISMDAGDTLTLSVTGSAPCTIMWTPREGHEYVVSPTGAITVSLEVTGAQRAVLTITATAACDISRLEVWGCPVTTIKATQYRTTPSVRTVASRLKYGVKSRSISPRQDITPLDAQSIVNLYAAFYREPRPVVTLVIETSVGEVPADEMARRMLGMALREIGDRLTVTDAVSLAFNGDAIVEQIDHTIEYGGARQVTKLLCESVEGISHFGRWGAFPTPLYSEWEDLTVWG